MRGLLRVLLVVALTGCGAQPAEQGATDVTSAGTPADVAASPDAHEHVAQPDAGCGAERTSCDEPAAASPVAACTTESYRAAVAAGIDGGHYPLSNERCDGQWAAFDVDFGADACAPEDDSCRGKRVHRTFWRNEAGMWRLITYQGSGDCAEVWAYAPEFPEAVCATG